MCEIWIGILDIAAIDPKSASATTPSSSIAMDFCIFSRALSRDFSFILQSCSGEYFFMVIDLLS